MHISKNFTLEEFTESKTADELDIENNPSPEAKLNLAMLCKNVLEPLREAVNVPIVITSGYRSRELNKAVGGVPDSQHTKGQAADIIVPGYNLKDAFNFIRENLVFDQAIYEEGLHGDWIHVSYKHGANRRMPMISYYTNGKREYKIA
jgi:hypothetical protein